MNDPIIVLSLQINDATMFILHKLTRFKDPLTYGPPHTKKDNGILGSMISYVYAA